MRLSVWSALFAVVLIVLVASSGAVSAFSIPAGSPLDAARLAPGDNDDDGLGDEMDPDDDNDGIPDNLDSAPFDPSIPGPEVVTTPDPVGYDEDTDGDGITNNADPDDNNDGVVDAPPLVVPTEAPTTVPATIVPAVVPATVQPTAILATTVPIADTPPAPPEEPVTEAPVVQVVTALPSTGTGSNSEIFPVLAILTGVFFLLMAAVNCRRIPSGR